MIIRHFFVIALLTTLGISIPLTAAGAESTAAPSAAEFLQRARSWRTADGRSTYAILRGDMQHRRRGGGAPDLWPVTFRIVIDRDSSVGQLVIGSDESYLLRNRAGENYRNFATSVGKTTEKLDRAGIKASDLVMGFISYELVKELEPGSLGAGLIPCRILLLKGPGEEAKVWFMKREAIPLKAEFYRNGESRAYRTIEISRGDKFDGVYCATQLKVSGPGWRTMVDFAKDRSSSGIRKEGGEPVIIDDKKIFAEHAARNAR